MAKRRDEKSEIVLQEVCNFYNVDREKLSNPRRFRELVDIRAMYYKISHEITDSSIEEIGARVNRCHATVLHSIRSIGNLVEYDVKIRTEYDILKSKLVDQLYNEKA